MSMPAILKQLQQASPLAGNLQSIKNMMATVRAASNPQAALNLMIQNNPNLKQAMDIVQQNGGDPRRAFYALCEQKGVDPQQILDVMK